MPTPATESAPVWLTLRFPFRIMLGTEESEAEHGNAVTEAHPRVQAEGRRAVQVEAADDVCGCGQGAGRGPRLAVRLGLGERDGGMQEVVRFMLQYCESYCLINPIEDFDIWLYMRNRIRRSS